MDLKKRNIIAEQFLLIMKQKLDLHPKIPHFDFKFKGTGDYMGIPSINNPEGVYLSKLKELTGVTDNEFLQVLNYCYSQKFIMGAQQYIRLTSQGMQKANEREEKMIEEISRDEMLEQKDKLNKTTKLTSTDKQVLERFFGMESGYVLNFSNNKFAEFFEENFHVNIYDGKYNYASGSKANRLRAFWNSESNAVVSASIEKLIEYWQTDCLLSNIPMNDRQQKLADMCLNIAQKIRGKYSEHFTRQKEEDEFLNKVFSQIDFSGLGIDPNLQTILKQRLNEIEKCLKSDISLGALFLIGSTLEGLLLGVAKQYPDKFNKAEKAPKGTDNKVKPFREWTLNALIEVSCEIGCLGLDVKKYSHGLRDFRNYIHPIEQLKCHFIPDIHTVQISKQVLLAAIQDLSDFNISQKTISKIC